MIALLAPAVSAQTVTLVVAERRGADRAHFVAEFPDKTQLDIDVPIGDATPEGIRAFILAKQTPPPILAKGTVINLLTAPPPPPEPPAPPPPSPFEVWAERARRLMRLKTLSLSNPDALQDIADLQEIVDLTYRKGFADGF